MKILVPPVSQEIENFKFHFPKISDNLEQDEEYLLLERAGEKEKILFHEYDRIFEIPGLYEKVFYEQLKCQSPKVVVELLEKQVNTAGQTMEDLRVLDLGAGNGMVAEKLVQKNVEIVIGSDIIPEAEKAATRDRPGVYDGYYISDFTDLPEDQEQDFAQFRFNTLITVAALGFGDIPPEAFVGAFNQVEDGGWVAFNIRDKFLKSNDDSGYQEALSTLTEEFFEVKDSKTYVHRYNIHGEPLTYKAFVGTKLKDLN